MENDESEDIFEKLAKSKRVREETCAVSYLRRDYSKDSKPTTKRLSCDLGDKIIQELERTEWDLGDERGDLAYDYFARDYFKVEKVINAHYEAALTGSDEENRKYLGIALNLTKRLERDFDAIRKVRPMTFSIAAFGNLPQIRDKIYLAIEFPECAEMIAPYYSQLQIAIDEEDYEEAALLRDDIKELRNISSEEL